MNPDLAALYVRILDDMRNEDLVAKAYERLGLLRGESERFRAHPRNRSLRTVGPTIDTYLAILGRPSRTDILESVDPYRRRVLRYGLDLWPTLEFNVWASADGVVGSLSFGRAPGMERTTSLLTPWHVVFDDMSAAMDIVTVDEWYPMKDIECGIRRDDGGFNRWSLRFDFGLLQDAVAVQDDGASAGF